MKTSKHPKQALVLDIAEIFPFAFDIAQEDFDFRQKKKFASFCAAPETGQEKRRMISPF